MYLPVALALLILLASHGGYAYPGGPPTSICNTSPAEMFLRPGASHGNPQNGNGGFLISTDLPVSAGNGTGGYDYEAGELYTVLINDTTAPTMGFRGFVVQAQSVPGGNLIGTFLVNIDESQQYLDCTDSMGNVAMATVTHNNGGRQNFMEQRILWRAPPEMSGTVEFRYSVVRRMPTYYSNLQASENRGEVLPRTTEPTSPPVTATTSTGPAIFELHTPSNCTHGSENCDRSVRFSRLNETHYTFDLEGDVGGGRQTGWVAVGFSQTQDMYSTDVFACGIADGTMVVEVLDTWNVAGSRQNLRDETQDDIQMVEARIMNNRITCSFTRTINATNPGRDIRLQDELFVMVGISVNQLSSNPLQLPTHVGGGVSNPFVSAKAINISSPTPPVIMPQPQNERAKRALVRAHGILMLIAWPLLTTVAIFFAGYMKCALPNGEWFQVHRALNLASLCLSLIAFILIFVSQYQSRIPGLIDLSNSNSTGRVHFSFGIIITFLQILNPILAIFRCKPDSKNRWIFNTFHGYMAGYIAQGLSWATVSLGLALFTSGYSNTFVTSMVPLWIFVGFCGFVLLYHIVMITISVLYWKKRNKCGSEDCKGGKCDHGKCSFNKEKSEVEMKPTVVMDDKKPLDEEEKKKPPSDSWWLWVGAGVYIGTTLVVVVVVIILVALD